MNYYYKELKVKYNILGFFIIFIKVMFFSILILGTKTFLDEAFYSYRKVFEYIGIGLIIIIGYYCESKAMNFLRLKNFGSLFEQITFYVKKNKHKKAINFLENNFLANWKRVFANAVKEKDIRLKELYFLKYLEARNLIYFDIIQNEYDESLKNNIYNCFDKIIKMSIELNEKESLAYAYANRAKANITIYKLNNDAEYKLNAKDDYNKAIEYIEDNNIKNELKKQLNKIA
ncbi:hypothetical protein WG909_07500 [Peptostreptococcaceae bacterium AGR-M142]